MNLKTSLKRLCVAVVLATVIVLSAAVFISRQQRADTTLHLLTATAAPGCAPNDSAVVNLSFRVKEVDAFSTLAEPTLNIQLRTSISRAKGRWSVSVLNSYVGLSNGFRGGICSGDVSAACIDVADGTVVISNVTNQALEGSLDLDLKTGQHFFGPFRAQLPAAQTGLKCG